MFIVPTLKKFKKKKLFILYFKTTIIYIYIYIGVKKQVFLGFMELRIIHAVTGRDTEKKCIYVQDI